MERKRGDGPLSSEQLERDAREDGAFVEERDAPGHMLPESERAPGDSNGDEPDGPMLNPTIFPPD